jgi:hypothetical protein
VYEFGQWVYIRGFEEMFMEMVDWFEKEIAGFFKALLPPYSEGQLPPLGDLRRRCRWLTGLVG